MLNKIKTCFAKRLIQMTIDGIKYDHILFVVDNPNDRSLGWMGSNSYGVIHPKKDVASTQTNHQFKNTIAHELGHGAFRLQHPFDQFKNTYGKGQRTKGKDKDNLMDYKDGDKRRAYQWTVIHP